MTQTNIAEHDDEYCAAKKETHREKRKQHAEFGILDKNMRRRIVRQNHLWKQGVQKGGDNRETCRLKIFLVKRWVYNPTEDAYSGRSLGRPWLMAIIVRPPTRSNIWIDWWTRELFVDTNNSKYECTFKMIEFDRYCAAARPLMIFKVFCIRCLSRMQILTYVQSYYGNGSKVLVLLKTKNYQLQT